MGQRRRLRVGRAVLNLTILGFAIVSIVSVIESDAVPTMLPIPRFAGEPTAILLLFGWIGVWLLVATLFYRWRWRHIGKTAGLTAEGGGLVTAPHLVGRVDGREVRAVSGDDHETVLTELASDTTAGAILGHLDESYSRLEFAEHADATDGDLAALASDPELAETLLTSRSREALGSADHTLVLFAGAVPNAFQAWDPDSDVVSYEDGDEQKIRHDTTTWDVFADRTEDKPGGSVQTDHLNTGGRQTVACVKLRSHADVGEIKDGDELRERTEAVTAVADAFEGFSSAPADVDGV